MATKKKSTELEILKVNKGRVSFCILGTTPIILNRLSQKAMRELLAPKGRKTAADKARAPKHVPLAEFRSSPYLNRDPKSPTHIEHLASAFKKAMTGAALDLPGASKAQIGRLLWVEGERIGIYGVPKLFMSPVRSADMNKTPDIRTRAIIPEWAARITVSFVQPMLKEHSVANLLASAGITQGIGDWRNEKGSGTYGGFVLVDDKDADFKHRVKVGGYKAQVRAMETPDFYDEETEELYRWCDGTLRERGFDVDALVAGSETSSAPGDYGVEGNGAAPPAA